MESQKNGYFSMETVTSFSSAGKQVSLMQELPLKGEKFNL